jgi:hypothetical protein
MGWKLTGSTSGIDAEVDATFKALRVSLRPMEVTAWLSIGQASALVTGVAAGGALFSLRQLASTLLVLRRIGVGFICTTAFTTAQRMEFGLVVARAFTASDTGGSAIALTGNNAKMRTSLGTLTSVDCRISTSAALGAGTKTLDTVTLAQTAAWIGAIGAGLAPSPNNLLQHDAGDYPLVLAQNEGINIQNLVAMGAVGVGVAYVNGEISEVSAY